MTTTIVVIVMTSMITTTMNSIVLIHIMISYKYAIFFTIMNSIICTVQV